MSLIGFFKKKEIEGTVMHPAFAGKVEPAFKCRGIQYYNFKEDAKMPYGRYQVLESFLLGYELRMDHDLFKAFVEDIESNLNGSRGTVNLAKAIEGLLKMKARAELYFDPEMAYKLASVVYFNDREDLYTYDMEINKQKLAHWKEDSVIDFFYKRPMAELLGLNNISNQDLRTYMKEATELLEDLLPTKGEKENQI